MPKFTGRLKDVCDGLRRRLSNREIAEELGIALSTVKGYVSTILNRLGVSTRVEAAKLLARASDGGSST